MKIRPEEPKDADRIRAVHLAAFPTSAEADLVERLRADKDSEISLVAEQSGEIVGHVVLSRMRVDGGGRSWRALGLGPAAVLPGAQGGGVGSDLIRGALAIARAVGEELVFVLGEPDYYRRFGFRAEVAAPFESPYAGPFLMALAFRDQPLPERGRADYAPAFGSPG